LPSYIFRLSKKHFEETKVFICHPLAKSLTRSDLQARTDVVFLQGGANQRQKHENPSFPHHGAHLGILQVPRPSKLKRLCNPCSDFDSCKVLHMTILSMF